MQQATRRALRATEVADDEIMAMRTLERMLLEAAIRLRRGRQDLVAVRDRVYERTLREERR